MLPSKPGEFTLLVGNRVLRLQVRSARIPDDPVGRLDVSLLQNLFLSLYWVSAMTDMILDLSLLQVIADWVV